MATLPDGAEPCAVPHKLHDASPHMKEQAPKRSALQSLEKNTMDVSKAWASGDIKYRHLPNQDPKEAKANFRLSIVSEGDERPADSPPGHARASGPPKARLSGSEYDWPAQLKKPPTETGVIVAEHDMQKLLPGQMRGFRPAPSCYDEAQGPLSARTLISGKSTARKADIDDSDEVGRVELRMTTATCDMQLRRGNFLFASSLSVTTSLFLDVMITTLDRLTA